MIAVSWPFPASSDDVARAGALEGRRDRLAAVADRAEVVRPSLAGRLGPDAIASKIGLAVLAARVLVGHDDEPATLAGDPAHERPLAGVALAGRAEHAIRPPPPAARRPARAAPATGLERGRAVGVVDDDHERLAPADPLHPAGHAARPPRGRRGWPSEIEAPAVAEGQRGQRVVGVESAGERQAEVEPRRPARPRRRSASPRRRPPRLERRPDVGRSDRSIADDPGAGRLGVVGEQPGVPGRRR